MRMILQSMQSSRPLSRPQVMETLNKDGAFEVLEVAHEPQSQEDEFYGG